MAHGSLIHSYPHNSLYLLFNLCKFSKTIFHYQFQYFATRVTDISSYLRAWVDILCVKRAAIWNTDQATLQILGTITRIAFLQDSKRLLGLKEMLHNLYSVVSFALDYTLPLFSKCSPLGEIPTRDCSLSSPPTPILLP